MGLIGGRVKTLHPVIHGGLLANRADPDHMKQLEEHGIEAIDMVVCNLYPFEKVRGTLVGAGASGATACAGIRAGTAAGAWGLELGLGLGLSLEPGLKLGNFPYAGALALRGLGPCAGPWDLCRDRGCGWS